MFTKGISNGAKHFSVRARPFASVGMVEIDRASVYVGVAPAARRIFFAETFI
jgi:hypothetical protein